MPLTYNKDLQEDKEGFFDAVDTVKFSLAVYSDMISTMTVNVEKWSRLSAKISNATDLADYLVRKGLPFRQAHEVVGKCVAYAIHQGKFLPEISLEEYKTFSALFEEDLLEALQPENCVAARTSYGGPAFSENAKQFSRGDVLLAEQQVVLDDLKARI